MFLEEPSEPLTGYRVIHGELVAIHAYGQELAVRAEGQCVDVRRATQYEGQARAATG